MASSVALVNQSEDHAVVAERELMTVNKTCWRVLLLH